MTGKELPQVWEPHVADDVWPLVALRRSPVHLFHCPHDSDVRRILEAGTGMTVSRFRLGDWPKDEQPFITSRMSLSPTGGQFAAELLYSRGIALCEAATGLIRRELRGHRGSIRVLGFTPDGSKLLTAGGDHTILVWDMRLKAVPLPDAVKNETNAAKLWDTLATGKADAAYLAMARFAREPDAALKLAKLKLKPAAKGDTDTDATKLTDCRAVELLEALDTDESGALLKELADGVPSAFRTQEAKRGLQRMEKIGYNAKSK